MASRYLDEDVTWPHYAATNAHKSDVELLWFVVGVWINVGGY